MLPAADYSALHRLIVIVGAVLLLTSVIGNLTYARRNVTLNIDLNSKLAQLQEVNQTQQQINAIAQDLMNSAAQNPWLIPFLQKYGLVRTQPSPQPPPAAK